MPVSVVHAKLKHDGCWSELTESHEDFFVSNVNLSMNSLEKSSSASVLIRVPRQNDFMEFKNAIKRSNSIRSINQILNISNSRNNHLNFLNFSGIYGNTIATIIFEEGSPYFHYHFENGIEYWTFLVNSRNILSEITERFSQISTIKSLEVERISNDMILRILSENSTSLVQAFMTKLQWDILKNAYRSGYYEKPHKISTTELSKRVARSPSTVNDHLRTIEKKIMDILLGNS
ncbi:MAG: helix-turn-helix domain-containing protein [Candidatus Thermoplasmatota archaeon]|jgi:predicted DNA binding protein|nr:helix-turn-helix domain-containing protein [Candidatus Thermoplasmatota archaeon]MCL6090847.1 helix-turn-helix domain-containing protein [Candidatus Thermoplasmatota archaeon]MDA8143128.1 helix-turn-helix domain-containing protein [Thermoplasmatales archaeon]